ncbi:hypothetical protein [Halomonas sp. BM-2019]|uniref:hypothetical protein n=1 Tax=Halomonas sp. BM-2019 TaxID=2811227 RepID=UPI001B3C4333|nr:MAG: hypothetical protein J5F18_01715 [Halomonas sp. BM-2019]
MSLFGLRRSLVTRLPGILLLWLLAGAVGVAYACSPSLDMGEQASQVSHAAAPGQPSPDPDHCDDHVPAITASLGKMPADDLRNLTAAVGLLHGWLSLSLLPLTVGEGSVPSGLSPHSPTPVYLVTARLRI